MPVKFRDVEEVRAELRSLVPDARITTDEQRSMLIVEGQPGIVDQVRELLEEIDRPEP